MGHTIRMDDERIPKMVVRYGMGERKRVGRPRQRWKKTKKEDISEINIGQWKEAARDRRRWKKIIEQVKGQLSL